MRSWGGGGALLLALALAVGLLPVTRPAQGARPDPARTAETFETHVLIPGPEQIGLKQGRAGRLILSGHNPLHVPIDDWNRREVFTKPATVPSTNQTVCATWRRQSEPSIQQGLAVRVVGDPDGRQRAVTVTKNVVAGYYWYFNVLTWDTQRPGDPWRKVAQIDVEDVVVRDGHWLPLPWRVCLRVHGRTLAFKVWLPQEEPEPSWHDSTHTRRARLPGPFVYPGRPGWYVGHLPAGQTTVYSELTD